jgi:hypothetical protein
MNNSGLGISIQAYLKSGNFNLQTGNTMFMGSMLKKAFVKHMVEHLGGFEQYD